MGVPTATREHRARTAGSVVVVLGVLAAAFAVTSFIVPRSTRGPAPKEPVAAPVAPAAVRTVSRTVVYELLGSDGARNVTYTAAGSALAQRAQVSTPWSVTFTRTGPADRTEFYSIAAQNPGPGELRCRILVDGVVVADKTVAEAGRLFSCAV
ncbi:MmpS family transport accessory protein [Amycolatopsis sp. SID8362]|uniref:MmpS family transport accessory protein n=1 Tax=Amycolatopsis sp. SID8362 TaxID=2690346 RepID=UPI00136DA000|nr:MmpS family transport accessory protein [Amycolatopsis sp. SID8362]NBH07146.1 hypothetical protein [Amycolatopsis sp. SID8362]NED43842.1 hypothetical protein [Amycolatopsis sp. SID8362]